MAITNMERVDRALQLLRDGLRPVCEDTWRGFYGEDWLNQVNSKLYKSGREPSTDDVAFLLSGIKTTWNQVFGHAHSKAVLSWVFEITEVRNRWAHQGSLTSDDTTRALDSMERLLDAFGNTNERDQIYQLRRELQRQIFEQEARNERRRTAAKSTEGTPQAGLTPWREIITPHSDVASGNFVQAEYAADLWQVHKGTTGDEYQDPHSFFARTYITQGLRDLLVGTARRLAGEGGDPVVDLQTNFGGGKTHSLIALYHLATAGDTTKLPGISEILAEEGITLPKGINRAVLVGHKIRPAAPENAVGGIRLHTLWGRLAYQLGDKAGYEMVRKDDLAGTNPGTALETLFRRFGPVVVLIDEWVAYARQLPNGTTTNGDGGRREPLAGGDFDTQFTFAQALTEAAAAVPNVVVLISIPASDIEVGGSHGRTALERLKNVVTRNAAQWQPATPEESFEIVRRRLFDPIPQEKARVRDGVIRAFCEMYRNNGGEFPNGVGEGEYRRRMEQCYPIHPELFNRLFDDWSALDKFQRTRGVLRLMALAISELWQRDDRSLLIMPGNLPMDFGPLVSEMKKYLEDGWDPVIQRDVDGGHSLPLALDQQNKHFGQLSAARRAARTVYLGSAPRPEGRQGVDIKSVVLGCAQPGESPQQFADALRRLSGESTHLYVDGAQYWYSLIANVTRTAEDRASNLSDHDADDEVRARIGAQRNRGAFGAVQVFAEGPGDVPDDDDGVRLVILEPDATHSANDEHSPAVHLAAQILANRDAGPRLNRNTVVFLAAAANRLAELRQATKRYLAWKSITSDEAMDLTTHQQRQAQTQTEETSNQVNSLIGETFMWVLTPSQEPGSAEVTWQTTRAGGASDLADLAQRASRKLASEEKLIATYSGVRVRMDLDGRNLWSSRFDMAVGKLWETYARFLHMPRLANHQVLHQAIANRDTTLSWLQETFAYAEAHDGERWMGLHSDKAVDPTPSGLLIHPDHLPKPVDVPEPGEAGQFTAFGESTTVDHFTATGESATTGGSPTTGAARHAGPAHSPTSHRSTKPGQAFDPASEPTRLQFGATQPTNFYAQFNLDPVRCINQMSEIVVNVSDRLGSEVELTLEIRATNPGGFDESTRRTVSENATNLKAQSSEFD